MRIFDAALFESFWRRLQDDGSGGIQVRAGRAVMWLLVPLFQGASMAKRAFFSLPFTRTRLPVFTVSIGNLSVGGTGKTTVTRLVASLLSERLGLETVLLCRGYRSRNREPVLLVSRKGRLEASPELCGDEARLLAQWLPACSVVLGKRRAVTGRWAVNELGAGAVILDDGLQYWRLERDLEIVTVGAVEGFGNRLPFPRGPLRESLRGLARAHCVIIFQAESLEPVELERLKAEIRELAPEASLIEVRLSCGTPRSARQSAATGTAGLPRSVLEKWPNLSVFAFCGIGSPRSFERTLAGTGARIAGMEVFPDHHQYTGNELDRLCSQARRAGADLLITTEKDEANLHSLPADGFPLAVLPVYPSLSGHAEKVLVNLVSERLKCCRVLPGVTELPCDD